jgi:hypothetical protein
MLALLVRAVIGKDAHLVAADPGDWGIDVLAGDLNGRAAIWQAKYFIDRVWENQYKEIRESFQSAVRNASRYGYAIEVWALCPPASLGPGATRWWQGWASRQKRATGIDIELWDETRLTEELLKPEAAPVRQEYYDSWSPPRGDGQADGGESRFLEAYRGQLRQYYGYLELPNPGAATGFPSRRSTCPSRSGKPPPGRPPGMPRLTMPA